MPGNFTSGFSYTGIKLAGLLASAVLFNLIFSSSTLAQSVSNDVSVNAAVDRELPTITITTPPDGSTVSDIVTIETMASDDGGIVKVEFYVDGFLKLTDTTTPYSFDWDSRTTGNGNHTIQATVSDIVGNTASDSASYIVDNPLLPSAETPVSQEGPSSTAQEKPSAGKSESPTRRFFLIDIPSLKLLAPELGKSNDFIFGVLIGIEIFLIIFLFVLIKRTKVPQKN